MEIIDIIIEIQDAYNSLGNSFSKRQLCEKMTRFKDQYNLDDLEILNIARNEIPLKQMRDIIKNKFYSKRRN